MSLPPLPPDPGATGPTGPIGPAAPAAPTAPTAPTAPVAGPVAPAVIVLPDATPTARSERHDPGRPEGLETPFKRQVAMAVALLGFLGGLLAFAAADASVQGARNSREAQRASVLALALQADGYSKALTQFDRFAGGATGFREADLEALRGELLGDKDAPARAAAVQKATAGLSGLTPLLADRVDPKVDAMNGDLLTAADGSELRQRAAKGTADAWGTRSDRYTALATALAVAVTLFGLALTVSVGIRRFLVVPASVIGVVVVALAAVVAVQPVRPVPERVLDAVIDGDRLTGTRDYEKAIARYDEALREAPEFAPVLTRRASAVISANSPERYTASYVVSSSTPKAYGEAIDALRRALALGDRDYATLVNLGAASFHVKEFAEQETFSRQAIALNPGPPLPWVNLALAQAGQGRLDDAAASYRRVIDLIRQRPSNQERAELYASARGTLQQLKESRPQSADWAQSMQDLLAAAESASRAPAAPAAPQASVARMSAAVQGSVLDVTWGYSGFVKGAAVLWSIYYRPGPGSEWVQRWETVSHEQWGVPEAGDGRRNFALLGCSEVGEYRVDLYVGGRLLRSATTGSQSVAATAGATSPRYDQVNDPVGRILLCRPKGWSLTRERPGSVDLASPDAALLMSLRTLPLPAPPTGAEQTGALVARVLDRLAATRCEGATASTQQQQSVLGRYAGTMRVYPTLGSSCLTWATVTPDGWLWTAVLHFPATTEGGAAMIDVTKWVVFY